MVFIILLFCLFFARPVFAAPVVTITVAPTSASSGSTIPIQFTVENSDPDISYHYKFFGGVGSSNTQIQTNESLTYTSDWDNFSIFTVDSTGKKAIDTTAYIKSDSPTGSYNLYVRIAKSDTHSSTYTSIPFNLNIIGPTPTPTSIPTPTPTPTNTPTPDPTITNPSSGISLTEFLPYSDPEWIEIYNDNNYPVKLVSWKVEDLVGNTKNIDNLSIAAKGYAVYELKSLMLDNNSDEKIILRNQDNVAITQVSYSKGQLTLDRSWSYVSGSWCQSSITKGYVNVTSCYAAPTSNIVTPTNTPTPDPTKYTVDETATESAIIEPTSESSFLSPSPTLIPTPTVGSILGDNTSEVSPKKNYLPLILIVVGGLLLTSPAIISKLKPKK